MWTHDWRRALSKNVRFGFCLLFLVVCKVAPASYAFLSCLCWRQLMGYGRGRDILHRNTPSQSLSSSAFLFFAATSSSFFLASKPSFARFILIALMDRWVTYRVNSKYTPTHFRLRTSSSINISFVFALNCSRNGGLSSFNLGSSSCVEEGSEWALSITNLASAISASSSSRFALSLSSDSACW